MSRIPSRGRAEWAKIIGSVAQITAEWLLICYRQRGGSERSVGIALYVPASDELYLRFRDDLWFADVEHHEILADASRTFRSMAANWVLKPRFTGCRNL
jgi:hypothetical protein